MAQTAKKSNLKGKLIAGALGAGFLGVTLGTPYYLVYGSAERVNITVTGTERVTRGNSEGGVTSKYLVYTRRADAEGKSDPKGRVETFENTDSWLRLKFASSDVQAQMQDGKTLNCTVYGVRAPIFSWYRNISSCRPVTPAA